MPTTCWGKTRFLVPTFLSLFRQLIVLSVNIFFKNAFKNTQHCHWLQIKVKHLLVCPNQKSDHHCDINRLVTRTLHLRINHVLYWMYTVLLCCRNVKPTGFEGRYASFTYFKKLSRWNRSFGACSCLIFEFLIVYICDCVLYKIYIYKYKK